MNKISDTAEHEFVLTRIINASRELVFQVWTDPKHIVNWWGPNGFTNTISNMDVKQGGEWNFIMHGPDGIDYPNKIVYTEVKEPESLKYEHGGAEDENVFKVEVSFDDLNGKTKLTMRGIFETKEERDVVVKEHGAIEGGNQTLDRLEEYLKSLEK
jgi:uncharacterized protein YndB with AHSA1/START domain